MPKRTSRHANETASGPRKRRSPLLPPLGLVALAVVALVVVTRPASPQLDSAQTQTSGGAQPVVAPHPDPPGTIDGAKNPDLIPYDSACRAVLLGIAEPEGANESQMARFHAKVSRAGLSSDDEQALYGVLAPFQSQLDSLQAQAAQIQERNMFVEPHGIDYQQLLDLSKQREQVFADALSAIPARLSAGGAAKFQGYVSGEKKGMKYLPEQAMTRH